MFKVVLACVLTIACSSICDAKTARRQLAQSPGVTNGIGSGSDGNASSATVQESEPALRGTLPVTGTPSTVSPPASTTTNSVTQTSTTTAVPDPGANPTTTTTTITTPDSSVSPTTTSTTTTTNMTGDQSTSTATSTDILYATSSRPGTTSGANTALRGMADLTAITVSARNLIGCPLSRDHDKGLKYVEVTVKNTGDNIAVILGNSAHADVNSANLPTAPASQAEDSDLPRLNTKGRVATGIVAAFSFGYAAPIFYENLTPKEHRKRYLGRAIGRDGARHEVEDEHFGLRVLMPGDETVGWIAFRCPRDQPLKSLIVPVSFTRSAIPAGSIKVQVADASSK